VNELVRLDRRGAVALITVDNPPVNALSPGVPEGIVDCLAQANADPQVQAVVLTGAGRGFIAGADIKHLGKPRSEKALSLRDALEASPKPVVAAIHGHALGGGLETALACSYRVAAESARVGLPEVLIGIIPGAGGTQRLPRLAGAEAALEMIVTGRHVPAPEAASLGILDRVVADGELLDAALAFAGEVAGRLPPPRVRDREDRIEEARARPQIFDDMRRRIARSARNQRAPWACIEAVEAAVHLPFEQGMARERELFRELVDSQQARALRYAFFAEREARKVPGVGRDVRPRPVRRVGIVGAGTMGGGIAMACAGAGLAVRILDRDREALGRGLERVRANYRTSVARGSLDEAEMHARLARIEAVDDYPALADCELVIEAVFEDLALKQEVFRRLDAVLPAGAVLASNTSALDIDALAAVTARPGDVLGTHFFSPANVMKLLEIVRGARTEPEVIATAMDLGRRIGKTVAVCGNCYGFVANRSRYPFGIESGWLLMEGASPEQVDRVMFEFGFPVGPIAVNDIAGIDVGYRVREARKEVDPQGYQPNPVADRLYELGRYGQKTGAGFYRYRPGERTPEPDPEVDAIIESLAREHGVARREIAGDEIRDRLLFAAVNEAARILDEGHACRPGDVDVMWVAGFGFPRYRGGLLYWADRVGVGTIHERIREWHARHGPRWTPAPLIERLARDGGCFADWQADRER